MSATVLPFVSKENRELRASFNRCGEWMLQQHRFNRQRKAEAEQLAASKLASSGAGERGAMNSPSDEQTCPGCGSPAASLLGRLGARAWVRCRACGLDRSGATR